MHLVCTQEQVEQLASLNLNFIPGILPPQTSTRLSEMKRVLREILDTIFNIAVGDKHADRSLLFDNLLASRLGKALGTSQAVPVFDNPIVRQLKQSYQV